MQHIDFIGHLHNRTKRDYVARVVENDKAECAVVAKNFDREYWDGDRKFGYGGYHYDGRWRVVAEQMAAHYGLKSGDRILDVGCGKGFLLYEFTQAVPGVEVAGLDISRYGIEQAKPEVKNFLQAGLAQELPFADHSFDFVVSLGTLHNLRVFELKKAVQEISRVMKQQAYIMVESYRNEREKANLLYWQLTCESFYSVPEWEWLYREWGYAGDYGFIFFE
ncbi:MAG TPA: class I SAM-dependent methyltransferase [Patescibacteria group bacterium]|nr:class I SAM-dependent methyltransferase [Patescibacteria group bacterium]